MENYLSVSDVFPFKSREELPEEMDSLSLRISEQDETGTSYRLVNTLFKLLIAKGIIKPKEVTSLLMEMHRMYRKTKEKE